jgi:hypothetical protein
MQTALTSTTMPFSARWQSLVIAAAIAGCANADLGGADDGGADARASSGVDATADGPVADAAAPDAAIPDAGLGPDADLPDGGPVCDWTQLLGNADFEAGRTIWNEDTGGSPTPIIRGTGDSRPFAAHAGTWAAYLLGYNSADVTLSQTVTVPAGATMLRLTGFKCWVTGDTNGDTMSIELRTTGGALLETLDDIATTDAGATCAWTAFTYTAGQAHAGQTIQLVLDGIADASTPTSFAFDTVALEALTCQ